MRLQLFVSLFLIGLAACNSGSQSAIYAPENRPSTVADSEATTALAENRKVIYDANLTIAVPIPDSANAELMRLAEELDGYLQRIGTEQSIIRVKSENLETALQRIEQLGNVRQKSITGQDVTEQFQDYEIRLENALQARTRYLELLEQASNVTETLEVERELERLNTTIDQLQGALNRLEHLIAYSTITIYWKEEQKPGLLGYVGLGLYRSVKWLFVRG